MNYKVLLYCSLIFLFGCSGSRTPSGSYHLKPWPSLPKYSNSFYTSMSIEDREMMDQREWKLNEFKSDAQKLETMHNKDFKH